MLRFNRVRGSFHLPLCWFVFTFVMVGFGVLGFLRNWRKLVETQLRLNQCVGEVALELRETLNLLGDSNQKINSLRLAIPAARIQPYLLTSLEVALAQIVASQEVLLFRWEIQKRKWFSLQGCGYPGDWAIPLPELSLRRNPPDSIGSQPLQWLGEEPSEFYLQIVHRSRGAAAQVERGSLDKKNKKWSATWTNLQNQKRKWPDFF